MPELNDHGCRNIFTLPQEGRSLPEHYRNLLFPDDREYAELTKVCRLVYQGKKSKEEVIADIPAAPFQEMRSFNANDPGPNFGYL